jgi:putative transposase
MAQYATGRGLSHRRSAWLCSTPRSGIGYQSKRWRRDRHLSAALRIVARDDSSWGYRLAGAYLRLRGWKVNDKRVYRLWQLNRLCLPPYRPQRKIKIGVKLEGLALRRNDVWAWDFVHDRYHESEPLRCLAVKDEATGFCLAIKTERRLQHQHVKALLGELITRFGRPRRFAVIMARSWSPQHYGKNLRNDTSNSPILIQENPGRIAVVEVLRVLSERNA